MTAAVYINIYWSTAAQGWAWELQDARSRRYLAYAPAGLQAAYATFEEAEQAARRRAAEKGWKVQP